MITIDTNVFLRWLLDDDKRKSEATTRLLKRAEKGEVEIWVPDLVIAEIAWVLRSFYKIRPHAVAEMIEPVVNAPMIDFENRDRLRQAVALYHAHQVDFTDCYIAAAAAERGLESVVSYDRDFDRLPVKRVEP
jgi:predicted nucleic-acid-binding protein